MSDQERVSTPCGACHPGMPEQVCDSLRGHTGRHSSTDVITGGHVGWEARQPVVDTDDVGGEGKRVMLAAQIVGSRNVGRKLAVNIGGARLVLSRKDVDEARVPSPDTNDQGRGRLEMNSNCGCGDTVMVERCPRHDSPDQERAVPAVMDLARALAERGCFMTQAHPCDELPGLNPEQWCWACVARHALRNSEQSIPAEAVREVAEWAAILDEKLTPYAVTQPIASSAKLAEAIAARLSSLLEGNQR